MMMMKTTRRRLILLRTVSLLLFAGIAAPSVWIVSIVEAWIPFSTTGSIHHLRTSPHDGCRVLRSAYYNGGGGGGGWNDCGNDNGNENYYYDGSYSNSNSYYDGGNGDYSAVAAQGTVAAQEEQEPFYDTSGYYAGNQNQPQEWHQQQQKQYSQQKEFQQQQQQQQQSNQQQYQQQQLYQHEQEYYGNGDYNYDNSQQLQSQGGYYGNGLQQQQQQGADFGNSPYNYYPNGNYDPPRSSYQQGGGFSYGQEQQQQQPPPPQQQQRRGGPRVVINFGSSSYPSPATQQDRRPRPISSLDLLDQFVFGDSFFSLSPFDSPFFGSPRRGRGGQRRQRRQRRRQKSLFDSPLDLLGMDFPSPIFSAPFFIQDKFESMMRQSTAVMTMPGMRNGGISNAASRDAILAQAERCLNGDVACSTSFGTPIRIGPVLSQSTSSSTVIVNGKRMQQSQQILQVVARGSVSEGIATIYASEDRGGIESMTLQDNGRDISVQLINGHAGAHVGAGVGGTVRPPDVVDAEIIEHDNDYDYGSSSIAGHGNRRRPRLLPDGS